MQRYSSLIIALMTLWSLQVCMSSAFAADDVPRIIPYQGWVQVDGSNYTGFGGFKFAIVNAAGDTTYWSHDGSSSGGSEPSASPLTLTVSNGLFSVMLGDTSVTNMSAIPLNALDNADAHLAIWFDDGVNGYAQLGGLQRLGASPFAFRAQTAQEADSVGSLTASPGDVLTADGSGGATWAPAPGASGGEANTGGNIGTGGVGPYDGKVGTQLQFKNINAGSAKVTVTDDTANDEIDIDINEAALTIDADTTAVSNIDAGELKSGFVDTDLTTVPGDDSTIASADAIKTYVDAQVAGNTDANTLDTLDSTDLLNRANHTGTQTASTISDFNTAADARIGAASVTDLSDVTNTGSGAIITAAERTKLSGIEANATADMSNAEIKAAYEANADTNEFSDAEQTKLAGLETGADVTDATNVAAAGAVMDSDISAAEGFVRKTGAGAYEAIKTNLSAGAAPTATDDGPDGGYAVGSIWIDTTNDVTYIAVDVTNDAAVWVQTGSTTAGDANTLDGLDSTDLLNRANHTGTQTASTISDFTTAADARIAAASVTDLSDVTDAGSGAIITGAERTKLSGIEANATADMSNAEIKAAYEANADTNEFSDAEQTKLAGIETNADVTDATNVAAAGAVMTSGAQTVAGVKTFTDTPVLGTDTAGGGGALTLTDDADANGFEATIDTVATLTADRTLSLPDSTGTIATENYADTAAAGFDTVSELTDTDISGPAGGNLLIYDGTDSWDDTAVSGDIAIAANGAATIQSDSVALATDTTGDYVESFTAGTGLTGDASGEGSTPTLNVVGGDGITANANDIQVDSTVLRTTGAQSIAGVKTFTDDPVIGSDTASGGGALTIHDDADSNGFEAVITAPAAFTADRTLTLPDADGTLATTADVATKQDADGDLTDIAALGHVDGNIIVSDGTDWVTESGSTARTSLGVDEVAAALSNLTATVGPAIGDDDLDGYSVGSIWVDVSADKSYVAVDVTTGAAVWLETGSTTVGEANTASNQGAGVGIFDGKSGSDLELRTLVEADGSVEITLDGANKEIDLSVDETALSIDADTTAIIDIDSDELKTGFLQDDDAFSAASATAIASSESIKAYVDAQVDTEDTLAELDDTDLSGPAGGNLLIYDGTDSWDDTAVSGDITIAANGAATIQSDSVALATDTTGDYVESFTAGTGLTGDASGEGSTPTLNVVGGDGITANANDIQVDSTVLRTTGAQSIAGVKTFTDIPVLGQDTLNGGGAITLTDDVNANGFEATIDTVGTLTADRTLSLPDSTGTIATESYADTAAAGFDTVDELTDTDISGPAGGNLLIYDGTDSWDDTAVSGDITIAANGAATIQSDSVALATDTTGDYVESFTAGTGLTGDASGEGSTPTLNVVGGDGITANANDIEVDSTVLRTTGAQSIAGVKTFTDVPVLGQDTLNGGGAITLTDDVNANGFEATIDTVGTLTADRTLSLPDADGTLATTADIAAASTVSALSDTDVSGPAGGNLLIYDGTDSWDDTAVSGDLAIAANGTATIQSDSVALATDTTGDYVESFTAGTGLTGDASGEGSTPTLNVVGGDGITANANDIQVDSTVLRTTGAQSIAGVKTFTDDPVIGSDTAAGGGAVTIHDDADSNGFEAVITAPAAFTADRTLTLPDASGTIATTADIAAASTVSALSDTDVSGPAGGNLLIYDGTDSWDDTAVSGDIAIAANGAATIQSDSVALATDTTGDYVESFTAGTGLTGDASGEGSTPTLNVVGGDGITANANDIEVDSTVLRTTGAQSIAGVKTFTDIPVLGQDTLNGGGAITLTDDVNANGFEATIDTVGTLTADRTLSLPDSTGTIATESYANTAAAGFDTVDELTDTDISGPAGGNLLIYDGTDSWDDTAVSGDITIAANGAATIQSDSVTLATDTTGDYVESFTAGTGLTGDATGEGSTPTLNVVGGDGITANANDIQVDSTVVRTTGAQSIAGVKTFTDIPVLGQDTLNGGGAITLTDDVNANGFEATIDTVGTLTADRTLSLPDADGTLATTADIAAASTVSALSDTDVSGPAGGNLLIYDGTDSWDDTAVSGDLAIAANGTATIQSDSVALATDTTGDYVESFTAGTGLTGDASGEGSTPTLNVVGGDGITANANDIEVDSTVLRTTGAQSIAGVKTFTDDPVIGEDTASGGGAITIHDDADSNGFEGVITAPAAFTADRTLTLPDASGTIATESYADTAAAGFDTVDELTDTDISGPAGGNLLIYDGTDSWDDTAVSGDITIAANGAATIQSDSVALATDTTGDYVESFTAGTGLTGDASGEGSTPTLNVVGGDGITANANDIEVDSTVLRTTGAQSIAGVKTFTDVPVLGQDTLNGGGAITLTDDVNANGFEATIDTVGTLTADRTLSLPDADGTLATTADIAAASTVSALSDTDVSGPAGGNLLIYDGTDSWDDTAVSGDIAIAANGTATIQSDSVALATDTTGDYVESFTAGTGLTGDASGEGSTPTLNVVGGDGITANANDIQVDSTVLRTTGAQSIAGVKTFTDDPVIGQDTLNGGGAITLTDDVNANGFEATIDTVGTLTADRTLSLPDSTGTIATESYADSAAAGFDTVDELTDTDISGPAGGNLLIYDGTDSWDDTAVSGDITIAANGAATIQSDSVALATDTTGDYVESFTAGTGLTGDASGEGSTPTLNVVGGDGITANANDIQVDSTVLRTTGAQSIAGVKTFTDIPVLGTDTAAGGGAITLNDDANANGFQATIDTVATLTADRTLSLPDADGTLATTADIAAASSVSALSDTDVSGPAGGNLLIYDGTDSWDDTAVSGDLAIAADGTATIQSDSVTLATDTTGDYVESFTAGTGLTGDASGEGSTPTLNVVGGDGITANANDIEVDSTVLRTTGAQSIAGVKTFTEIPVLGQDTLNGGGAITLTDDVNANGFEATIDTVGTLTADRTLSLPDSTGTIATESYADTAAAGFDTVDELTDTDISGPAGGNLLIYDGTDSWDDTAVSGDITIAANGAATIQSDSVTLATDTTGDYVESFTAGTGLTGDASGEGSTPTLNVVGGDGITANANDIQVDSTVLRTTGAQSIAGVKSFTDIPVLGTDTAAGGGAITLNDDANANGFQATIDTVATLTADRTLSLPDADGTLATTADIAAASTVSALSDTDVSGPAGGNLLIYDGTDSWDDTAVSGDLAIAANGTATIQSDSVALATDTTGDYVESFTAGTGLTGDASGEGSTPTLNVVGGDGITANANDIQVDSTVLRTTGAQSIAGVKTFTDDPVIGEDTASGGGAITLNDDANANGFQATIDTVATLTADRTLSLPDSTGTIATESYADTAAAGFDTVSELTDTDISGPAGGNLLIYDGTDSWDDTAVSGDITIAANGAATIQSDSVALATDTTGDYVESFTAGTGLTGDASGEGSTPTLNVVGGDGITANANDIEVDSTVLRTTGAQSIAGVKTFTDDPVIGSDTAAGGGAVTIHDDADSNGFEAVITAPAAFTADRTLTLPDASGIIATTADIAAASTVSALSDTDVSGPAGGNLLIYDGTDSWDDTAVSGDIAIAANGTATIQSDSVALATDTTGDYVESFTAGTGLTGDASGEGSTPTLNVVGGDGITANANDIQVDSTVLRTTGAQSIAGVKTFTDIPVLGQDTLNGGGAITLTDDVNANGFEATIDTVGTLTADRTLSLPDADGTLATTADIAAASTVSALSDTDVSGPAGGNLLIYDGTDSWDDTAVSGDLAIAANGTATIQSDSVALATDTTGDYVESFTAGTGLTGDASGEGSTPTLNVVGGDGITANANDIEVDSTVLRTTGAQSIAGVKTFTDDPVIGEDTASGGGAITIHDDANANGFEAIITAPAAFTADRTLTLPDASGTIATTADVAAASTVSALSDTDVSGPAGGNLLIYDGTDSWDDTAVSGDLAIAANGTATIQSDSVALATDTTGDYVESFTAGTGLTGDASGEGSTPTLNVVGGDGITANANDIEVDSTVLRTTGAQSIAGVKTFTDDPVIGEDTASGGGAITIHDDANANGFEAIITAPAAFTADRTLTLPDASGTLATTADVVADGTTLSATLRWDGSAWVEETSATIDASGNIATTGNVDLDGRFSGGQSTLAGSGGTETGYDVSGLTSLKVDTSSSGHTLDGLTNGVAGQEIRVFNAGTNTVTITHSATSGNQDFLNPGADNVVLASYGGVTLVCDGTSWFVIERAPTYED